MRTLLYLIAFLWMAFGAYLIIFTEKARNTAKKIFETQKMKRLAVLPFVFGLLLMIGAFFNPDIFWFTFILGLLAIAKGLFFYLAPIERSKALMDWWFYKTRPETVRFMALILFVLGMALFSFLR